MRAQRAVAAQVLEQQPLHQLERGEERGAHQAGGHAHERGVEQRAPDDPQVGRASPPVRIVVRNSRPTTRFMVRSTDYAPVREARIHACGFMV